MSLTKLCVTLAIAVALLPTDKVEQQKLVDETSAFAHWAWTYCDRNPDTCTTAANGWDVFKQKAAFGWEIAQDAVTQTVYQPSDASNYYGVATAPQDTLTQDDRAPNWRGEF